MLRKLGKNMRYVFVKGGRDRIKRIPSVDSEDAMSYCTFLGLVM